MPTSSSDRIHNTDNAVVLTINDSRNRDGSATTEATLKQSQPPAAAPLDTHAATKPDFITDAHMNNNSNTKDFAVSPESLSAFVSPHKDHAALAAMGHIAGVMSVLRVDEA
ncbi:hypothetical protein HDU78_004265, partial [Chytriomyces hyalinus]